MIDSVGIAGIQGSPVSGTSMVLRGQDPFFGSIGSIASQFAGLSAPGRDGQLTPVFRSNLLGRRDPSMTGRDYRMADIYGRRMADMAMVQQMAMSRSVDRMFDEGSALGSFMYERDANGNFVQSPGAIGVYNMLRSFATGPNGAGMVGNLVNGALGYDRGAGMEVFAKQANAMAAAMPGFMNSSFRYDRKSGTLSYMRPDMMSEGFNRSRTTFAGIMQSALQGAMYDGGLVKNWDTTHGISEGLAARIMSDAVRNGRLSQKSYMTDEDRELKAKSDELRERIADNNAEIRDLREKSNNPTISDTTRAEMNARADQLEQENAKFAAARKEAKDMMTSVDWDGDIESVTERVMDIEDQIRKKMDAKAVATGERDDLEAQYVDAEQSGDSKRAERLSRILEQKNRELEMMDGQIDQLVDKHKEESEKVEDLSRSILKEVSGAVDTAKALYGDESTTYSELYRMTGGGISKSKGMAHSMNLAMQEYLDAGQTAGYSNEYMSGFLGKINQSVRSGYGSSGLFADTALSAKLTMRYATAAMIASGGGGSDDTKNEQLGAAADWRAGQAATSTMRPLLVQLQTAYREGAISKDQYESLATDLTSGDESTRAAAQKRLYKSMYNGDVDRGYEQLNDPAQMQYLESNLIKYGSEAVDAVAEQFDAVDRNETEATFALSRDRRRRDIARKRLEASGFSAEAAQEVQDETSVLAARDVLGDIVNEGGKGSAEADVALNVISEIMGSTDDKQEQFRKVAEFLKGDAAKGILGDSYTRVASAIMSAQEKAMSGESDSEVGGEISGEFKNLMGLSEGATNENGHLTRGNLGQVVEALFGSESLVGKAVQGMSEEERNRYEEASEKAREAMSRGDVVAAQKIANDYVNSSGKTLQGVAFRAVERDAQFQKPGASDKNYEFQATAEEAEWLKSQGLEVTNESLAFARNRKLLQARPDGGKEFQDQLDKLRKDQARASYKANTPGADAIVKFIEGEGSFGDIVFNSNVAPEDREATLRKFAEGVGFTGAAGDGSGLLSMISGETFDVNSVVQGLGRVGGENADLLADIIGADKGKTRKMFDRFQKIRRSGNAEDMQTEMSRMTQYIAEHAEKQYKDFMASDEAKTPEGKAKAERLERLMKEAKGLSDKTKSGAVDVAKLMQGMGAGGASSEDINALIDRMNVLIEVLQRREMGNTYGG